MLSGEYLRIVDRSPTPGPDISAGPSPTSGILYVEVPYHQADLYATLTNYALYVNGAYAQNMIIAPANDGDTINVGMKNTSITPPQTTTLNVFVRDSSNGNAILPSIQVRINMTAPTPGAYKYAITNSSGYAPFPLLYPGTYACIVNQDGWVYTTPTMKTIPPGESVDTVTLYTQRTTIAINTSTDGHGAISYTYKGVTKQAPASFPIISGDSVALQATPSSGYKFNKWETTNIKLTDPTSASITITPTFYTYVTLRATFVQDIVIVTLSANSGGTINPVSGQYSAVSGSTFHFTATPNTGYRIDSITLNGALQGTSGTYNLVINQNSSVVVTFVDNTVPPPTKYTLLLSSSGGGATTPPSGSYQYLQNTNVSISAAIVGGTFLYWQVDGVQAGSNPSLTVKMDANHTVIAFFNKATPPLLDPRIGIAAAVGVTVLALYLSRGK